MYEFYLKHIGRDGIAKHAEIRPYWLEGTLKKYSGILDFSLGRPPNAPGTASYAAWLDLVNSFEEFDLIIVFWRNTKLGFPSGGGFTELDRFIVRETSIDGNRPEAVITAYHIWHLLDWRHPLYPTANANQKFSSEQLETIGKTLVTANCTSAATTAAGRWFNGDLSGMGYEITVEADGAAGDTVEFTAQHSSTVRANIERLASRALGDFALASTVDDFIYQFQWRYFYQGDDKYDSVIFSTDKRNVIEPRKKTVRIGTGTRIVSAGEGTEAARDSDIAYGPSWAADNDIEVYVDARDVTGTTELASRAAQKAYELRPFTQEEFTVVQTADTFACNVSIPNRQTYWVGDSVQTALFGDSARQEVSAISFSTKNVKDAVISAFLGEPEPPDNEQGANEKRIDRLEGKVNTLLTKE